MKNEKIEIKELFAFVSSDEHGEGIIAINAGNMMMPLVGSDMVRVEAMKPVALKIGEQSNTKVILKRFALVSLEPL